ncbi:alpha/beta hydrolase [Bauldia litoralis]|uniref:Phospholipase/carboxylesterase n=1 Tax=Bauldia litoralis TaxID=665467 RepID=A0A1G6BQM5_9HYPH|nr:dienelactone hydrolase family protein [Bauldia litoralis]SDB22944.1 phospholipase/carboxylesterase [Bauldia litoralis]
MIDGPRIPPASGGPARHLVVLLHGYGADGNDLIDIGRHWAPLLPDTAFVSPNAPEPCDQAPMGRQWFPLSMIDMDLIADGVRQAAPVVDAFLDSELASLGLTDANLALVGFSQGAMMALHVGPRRPAPIAGIVSYSGMLAGPERLAEEAVGKPPVLLVHGDADPIVPVMALHGAVPALAEAGFAAEWHVSPGLEHGIDGAGLQLGAAFLRRVLV